MAEGCKDIRASNVLKILLLCAFGGVLYMCVKRLGMDGITLWVGMECHFST